MPDQLIADHDSESPGPAASHGSRPITWGVVGLVLALSVLCVAAGAVGGWWWWRWWSPAPAGVIGQDQSTGEFGWYPDSFDHGQTHMAASTFQYVVIGFVLAAVVGLVASYLGRNRPILALATLGCASVVASAVMAKVGFSLSPSDPSGWANASHVGESHPGWLTIGHADLRLWSWAANLLHLGGGKVPIPTPILAWPIGALATFGLVMLLFPGVAPDLGRSGEAADDPPHAG